MQSKLVLKSVVHHIIFDVLPICPSLYLLSPAQHEGFRWCSGIDDEFLLRMAFELLALEVVFSRLVKLLVYHEGSFVKIAAETILTFL